nr:spore coat protein U domain-containing protein [Burkholderia cepacia]
MDGFASATDFGRLDFGEHGPTWAEYLTADSRAADSGQVSIACSPNIGGILVSIDSGRNGPQSTRYVVKRDAAGHVVARTPYKVYRDPARRTPYVPLIPQSFRVDAAHTKWRCCCSVSSMARLGRCQPGLPRICLALRSTGEAGRMMQ